MCKAGLAWVVKFGCGASSLGVILACNAKGLAATDRHSGLTVVTVAAGDAIRTPALEKAIPNVLW
jgi:hypothetical protein